MGAWLGSPDSLATSSAFHERSPWGRKCDVVAAPSPPRRWMTWPGRSVVVRQMKQSMTVR